MTGKLTETGIQYIYPLVTVILFWLSCAGIGLAVLQKLKTACGRKARLPLSAVLGMNLNAIFFYLSSFLGHTGFILSLGFVAAGILTYLYILKKSIKKKERKFRFPDIYGCFFILFFVFLSGAALCPPIGWDELTYHLAVPARWMSKGFPEVFKDLPYSGFPSFCEFIYLRLMGTGGTAAPGIFILSAAALSLYNMFLILKPGLSGFKTWVMMLSFAFAPALFMLYRETYVEPVLVLNVSAAILYFKSVNYGEKYFYLIPPAIFAGTAAAIKLTGISSALTILLLYLFQNKKTKLPSFGETALFGFISGFLTLIYYLRPWIMTGNPVYPFYAEFFGGGISAQLVSQYHFLAGSFKYGLKTLPAFFLMPVIDCLKPDLYDGSFGLQFPVMFFLAGTGTVYYISRRFFGKILIFPACAFITYVFWFFTSQQIRFLLPCLIFIILSFKYLSAFISLKKRQILFLVIALTTLAGIRPVGVTHFVNCWRALLDRNTGKKNFIYSGTGNGYLQAVEAVSKIIPENSRYLLIYERRGFYFPTGAEIATPGFQEKYFTPLPRNKTEFLKELKQADSKYVVTGSPARHPDRVPGDAERLKKFSVLIKEAEKDENIKLLWRYSGYSIYKVTASRQKKIRRVDFPPESKIR